MLREISFFAGAGPDRRPLVIEPGRLTVILGPNNAGKSLALREIDALAAQVPPTSRPRRVVSGITWGTFSSEAEFRAAVEPGVIVRTGTRLRFLASPKVNHQPEVVEEIMFSHFANPQIVGSVIGRHLRLRIDGKNRVDLAQDQGLGDLQQPPDNTLTVFFRDSERRARLREIVHDAFGWHLVLDPTHPGQVRVRMSERPPQDLEEEQSLSQRSVAFHGAALPLEDFSDGVRAFVGILLAVLSSHYRLILIDEPEAFLHPSLARRLGQALATIASGRQANVIVATHSSDFMAGCVEGGSVATVRLTHTQRGNSATKLSPGELQAMMRQPLLRSANVLGGLFFTGVVVAEGDADRAFYQEMNYRMGAEGAKDTLFLNAQNKQTIDRIVSPLRSIGVPAAGVYDLDILKNGGEEWTRVLRAARIPGRLHEGMANQRAKILDAFGGLDLKRNGGIRQLDADDLEAAVELFDQLDRYGIFVVREGELEAWLPDLAIPQGSKTSWIVKMFERLGADPESPDYVKPRSGDVWAFMAKIAAWISNPDRKGLAPA